MEWRSVPGFEGYRVSDTGVVQSSWKKNGGPNNVMTGKWWTMQQTAGRYLKVNLRKRKGKKTTMLVHTIVLTAFVGPRPQGLVGRHLDGNTTNNRLTNLAWGTSKQNSDDCLRHGNRCRGEQHYAARLTQADVDSIRASERSDAELATSYGVSEGHVYKIRTCERWNTGDGQERKLRGRSTKLSEESVEAIRASKETTVALARKYGISQPYVSRLKRGLNRPVRRT